MDIDGSQSINELEMNRFLQSRNVMEEHREEIVAEIFQACDIDKSG